jgi:hypothetical protein
VWPPRMFSVMFSTFPFCSCFVSIALVRKVDSWSGRSADGIGCRVAGGHDEKLPFAKGSVAP